MLTFEVNRPRHKAWCKAASDRHAYKNSILQLVRALLANPGMMVPIKSYIRGLLDIDHDYKAGLRWNVHFTVTTIPDDVSRGIKGEQRIFQIAKVEKVPIVDNAGDLQELDAYLASALSAANSIPVCLTFITDEPGQGRNKILFTIEQIFPEMLSSMPATLPGGPVMWLL